MRILVVEDDRKVAAFIQRGLEEDGYAVDVLHDGADAAMQAQAVGYDAAVLDLMLPTRSGFQVLREIRARKANLPVLMLTAKDSIEDRVTGLDSGADDYMIKPFALAELSARIGKVVEYLDTFSEKDFADLGDRRISLPRWEGKSMAVLDYFIEHAVPNFFFHASMTYALLRNNGVDVGKRDFLGAMSMR